MFRSDALYTEINYMIEKLSVQLLQQATVSDIRHKTNEPNTIIFFYRAVLKW